MGGYQLLGPGPDDFDDDWSARLRAPLRPVALSRVDSYRCCCYVGWWSWLELDLLLDESMMDDVDSVGGLLLLDRGEPWASLVLVRYSRSAAGGH